MSYSFSTGLISDVIVAILRLMENWVIYDGNRCGHPGLTDVLNNWYDEQLSSGKLVRLLFSALPMC